MPASHEIRHESKHKAIGNYIVFAIDMRIKEKKLLISVITFFNFIVK